MMRRTCFLFCLKGGGNWEVNVGKSSAMDGDDVYSIGKKFKLGHHIGEAQVKADITNNTKVNGGDEKSKQKVGGEQPKRPKFSTSRDPNNYNEHPENKFMQDNPRWEQIEGNAHTVFLGGENDTLDQLRKGSTKSGVGIRPRKESEMRWYSTTRMGEVNARMFGGPDLKDQMGEVPEHPNKHDIDGAGRGEKWCPPDKAFEMWHQKMYGNKPRDPDDVRRDINSWKRQQNWNTEYICGRHSQRGWGHRSREQHGYSNTTEVVGGVRKAGGESYPGAAKEAMHPLYGFRKLAEDAQGWVSKLFK